MRRKNVASRSPRKILMPKSNHPHTTAAKKLSQHRRTRTKHRSPAAQSASTGKARHRVYRTPALEHRTTHLRPPTIILRGVLRKRSPRPPRRSCSPVAAPSSPVVFASCPRAIIDWRAARPGQKRATKPAACCPGRKTTRRFEARFEVNPVTGATPRAFDVGC